MKQIKDVLCGKIVKSFDCCEQEFVLHVEKDWKPLGMCEDSGSCVQSRL